MLIIDANVLFSFFKRDSFTRRVILTRGLKLYAPELIREEIDQHAPEIMEKARISQEQFLFIKNTLSAFITFVPLTEFRPAMIRAAMLTPDPDDTQYLALALTLSCPVWSNDKQLKKQSEVQVISSKELAERLLGSQ